MTLELDIRVLRAEYELQIGLSTTDALALIGKSGSGKSTVLRAVAGVEYGVSGEIIVGEEQWLDSPSTLPPTLRSVGFLAQRDALFPHLTALDNVAFGLRADGCSRARRRERGLELLEILGLADHASVHPHELSGGQRRRVALARALAPERAVYLLDEPFVGLDPTAAAVAAALIEYRLSQVGAPALIAVHESAQVEEICSRAVRLDHGRVAETLSVGAAPQHARGSARVRQSIGGRQLDCREGSR